MLLKEYKISIPQQIKIYSKKNYLIISKTTVGRFIINVPINILIKKQNNTILFQSLTNLTLLKTFFLLIKNLFKSFNKLYTLRLFLKGIGFRVALEQNFLNLKIGFSHSSIHLKKSNIKYNIYKNCFIDLQSPLKDKIGYEGYEISQLKTPDAYKAKGIHTKGITIKTKIGKKA